MKKSKDIEKRLFEAAIKGHVPSLLNLLEDDPVLLDRFIVGAHPETPLHIVAMLGHVEFAHEVISRKPELASELDSQGSTPLHIAAGKGNLTIVKELLMANAETCFLRDKSGRNPVHVSAVKGRVDVLKEMIQAVPGAALQTMTNRNTIMHLCVKNNRLDSLKAVVECIEDDALLNEKNADGDTILHLAAADQQSETIHFLINNTKIDRSCANHKGLTALAILAQADTDKERVPRSFVLSNEQISERPGIADGPVREKGRKDWLEKMSNALMVVAILIATMAFQAGLNPPGGVWQDNPPSPGQGQQSPNRAGHAILAYNYPRSYSRHLIYNTTSFVASLSIILLLISGLPLRRRFFIWMMMVIMWIAVSFNAAAYITAINALTPRKDKPSVAFIVSVVVLVWIALMAVLLGFHTTRLLVKLVKKVKRKMSRKPCLHAPNSV